MKLHGKDVEASAKAELRLPRMGEGEDIVFRIVSLPLGIEERAEELFPNPNPPMGYAKTARGGIVRDPKTKKPMLIEDTKDPVYRKANVLANRRQMSFFIQYSLCGGGDVEFEVQKPQDKAPPEEWETYVDSLFEELKGVGFSIGDFIVMVDSILEVSNMKGDAIEEAKESFLSGAESLL